MKSLHDICATFTIALAFAATATAQRAIEERGEVIYVARDGTHTSIGPGFNPIETSGGRIAFIHGRKFDYGEDFDCKDPAKKNWIALYDPRLKRESVLFDRDLPFEREGIAFCVFDQMQLSPDDLLLYLVSPVWATSGSLAIVRLGTGAVHYVAGVECIYVIATGAHRGEVLYVRRLWEGKDGDEHPYYPWVHARADGSQIKIIAEEWLTRGGTLHKDLPHLAAYLRQIDAQIVIDGEKFP